MLAPWIIGHFPPHRVYVEPFGGAASVLLRKPRSYAEVYNDLDGEIVNLFRVVRERGAELTRALIWTPFSRTEYRVTAFEPTDDPVERARRTVIRSYMGFGSNAIQRAVKSGFRATSNRSGTTPAHDWRNFPPTMRAVAKRLRGVVIENAPAADVIAQRDSPATLIYADPPYVHSTRMTVYQHGHHGYGHEMTDVDHEALAAVLHECAAMVVLSGYPSPLYERLYAGWHRVEKAALADGAEPRTEVLWMNAAATTALRAETCPLFPGIEAARAAEGR